MAKGIEIGVASETKAFKQGIDTGVIAPMEDAVAALDALGKSRGPDQLEDGLQDAQKASERLQRETKQTADSIEREFRTAYRDVKNSSEDATRSASGNIRELGNESKANLAETLASFDGTVEGTLSGIQGTLGGVTAGLSGIAPIVAAAAGAAGVGLIIQAMAAASEDTAQFKAQVSELATELIETGEVGGASVEFISSKLKELAVNAEDGETNLTDLAKAADRAERPFDRLAQAYAGNTDELDQLVRSNKDLLETLYDEQTALDTTTNAGIARQRVLSQQITGQEEYNTYLAEAKKVADEAALADENYARSGADALAAKAALVATIDDAYDKTASAVTDYVNAETGLFDVSAYITAMQAREEALRNYQTTLNTSGLSEEAKGFLNEQGAESAALMLQGYAAAAPDQRAELQRIWTESAKASSGSFTEQVGKDLSAYKVAPISVPLSVDDSALRNFKPKVIRVGTEFVTRNGTRIE